MTKCTCGNAHSAPSHNLYGTHENSIPFLHRDLAAADFTSLSLLNRETCQMFGAKSIRDSQKDSRAPSDEGSTESKQNATNGSTDCTDSKWKDWFKNDEIQE
jgi:hypothetical protein